MTEKTKREAWKTALAQMAAEVSKDFKGDPRLEQLNAAVRTALMAIDNMHDYPQYTIPTH